MNSSGDKRLATLFEECDLITLDAFRSLDRGLVNRTFLLVATRKNRLYSDEHPKGVELSLNDILRALCPDVRQRSAIRNIEELGKICDKSSQFHFECHAFDNAPARTRIFFIVRFDRRKWDYFPSTCATNPLRENTNLPSYIFTMLEWVFFDEYDGRSMHSAFLVNPESLVTSACEMLLDEWYKAIGDKSEGLLSLHETAEALSITGYENRSTCGALLITRDRSLIRPTINLERETSVSDRRALRKLLEVTTDDRVLLSDGKSVYGIAKLDRELRIRSNEPILIEFIGRHRWRVVSLRSNCNKRTHYEVFDGRITLPPPKISEAAFRTQIRGVFRDITDTQVNRLWKNVSGLLDARHGALVVVDAHAAAEADRLRQQAQAIKPVRLNVEGLVGMAKVDGALLFDLDGYCHAFAVILDGHANPNEGDSARGSRYNSAVRYISARAGLAVAVVVSEDGSVDFIPRRIPRDK